MVPPPPPPPPVRSGPAHREEEADAETESSSSYEPGSAGDFWKKLDVLHQRGKTQSENTQENFNEIPPPWRSTSSSVKKDAPAKKDASAKISLIPVGDPAEAAAHVKNKQQKY